MDEFGFRFSLSEDIGHYENVLEAMRASSLSARDLRDVLEQDEGL